MKRKREVLLFSNDHGSDKRRCRRQSDASTSYRHAPDSSRRRHSTQCAFSQWQPQSKPQWKSSHITSPSYSTPPRTSLKTTIPTQSSAQQITPDFVYTPQTPSLSITYKSLYLPAPLNLDHVDAKLRTYADPSLQEFRHSLRVSKYGPKVAHDYPPGLTPVHIRETWDQEQEQAIEDFFSKETEDEDEDENENNGKKDGTRRSDCGVNVRLCVASHPT